MPGQVTSSWFAALLLVMGGWAAACRSTPDRDATAQGSAASVGADGDDRVQVAANAPPRAIKIGLLAPFSGPFASSGAEIEGGVRAYLEQRAGKVAGHPIELLVRDTTGLAPELAKRLAQLLIAEDHVDFLAGFALTPNALAVLPVATEANKPMVIMNAATSGITARSPYAARVSFTLPQVTAPLARWAAKNGITSVYTLVSDYGPGHDAEAAFSRAFVAQGGKIVGSSKAPLQDPDFAPLVQRIEQAKPRAVFVFVPAGVQSIAFMKAFRERDLARAGVTVLGTGDLTDDHQLPAMGDAALGVITTHHYSVTHPSRENAAFKAAFSRVTKGTLRPNFIAVGGYDGMTAIATVIEKLGASIDGDAAMKVLSGLRINSPRGPLSIDAVTRDPVQTVYVRKVERKVDGLFNVEFDEFIEQREPDE